MYFDFVQKRMARCVIFCFFILFSLKSLAQYVFSGKVTTAQGQPVSYADIYDESQQKIYSAKEDGAFYINFPTPGRHSFVFFADNFGKHEQEFELLTPLTETNIILTKVVNLSGVELWADRTYMSNARKLKDVEGTSIYSGKKVESVILNNYRPNISSGTQRQLFAQIAGLNIYENNQASLQLHIGGRGLNPNRTSNFNTRQNDYDISADVLGYPESYYTPPPQALKEIIFIRGAASLQYGTQFGGLINFKFKDPPKDKKIELYSQQLAGSFGLLGSFNSLSGTIKKFSYYTFFNYKQGNGFRPNSFFSSYNFFGRFMYDISPKTQISLDATVFNYLAQQPGGITDSQFYKNMFFSNRTRNWFYVNWNLFNMGLKHQFSEYTRLSVNVFGLYASRKSIGFFGNQTRRHNAITDSDEKNDEGYVSPRDLISGIFRNWGAEVRVLHQYFLGKHKNSLLLGGKYYQSVNTSLQGPGSKNADADFRFYTNKYPDYRNQSNFQFPNLNFAFFGEHIFALAKNFSVTPGFRYDYIQTRSRGKYQIVDFDQAGNAIGKDVFEENKTFPRHVFLLGVGVSYKPLPRTEIYGNISKNYRSVTFNDIRTVSPTFIIDPSITDESGYTTDFGLRGNLGRFLSYDANVFSILYNNRIGLILDDRANRIRTNVGDAIIYGLESLVTLDIATLANLNTDFLWKVFNNLALTKSRYFRSKINGIKGNELEFVPAINLKTGIDFGYKNLIGNVQYSFLSRQFTESTNAPQDKADVKGGIVGYIPSYGVMDVSLAYRYKIFRLEGGINNVLDKHYFTQRATSYPGPGIIPAQPMNAYLGLSVKF